jgi:peptide/nickel transport system permease protein
MIRIVLRRLLVSIPLLLLVSALSFFLASFTPGNVATSILGTSATPQAVADLLHRLGLDRPLWQQYGDWLGKAVTGDLGSSVYSNEAVTTILAQRLPVTLSLTILSLIVVIVLGIALGSLSAIRGGWLARVIDVVSVGGMAVPNFWSGAVLISLFAVSIRIFPASGYVALEQSPSGWLLALVLPVAVLAGTGVATIALNTRSEMIAAMQLDFVRSLRANGIPAGRVLFVHALKNAGGPIVTVLSLQFVGLLGGTIVIESVFGMGGLGTLAVQATHQHDLPVIQGIVMLFTVIVVVVYLITDIVYSVLNPKVRAS